MTAGRGKRAATNCEWLTRHVCVDRVDGPTAEHLVNNSRSVAQEMPASADRHFPHRRARENVRAIEVGTRPLFAEVANVCRRARVSGGKTATGRRTDRIDRLIVDRLTERISHTQSEAGAETSSQSELRRVII